FRLLCHEFDRELPFSERSNLQSAWFAHRLFYSSKGGIIGRLADFLYSAGCLAINDASERIEVSHFAQAYEYIKPRGQFFNPWVHDLSQAPKSDSTELRFKGRKPRDVFTKESNAGAAE